MADIFLSYVREDRARAEQLATALGQLGWNVWWDRKILPGRQFRKVIARELQAAKCVVVLWSQTSVDSDYVCDEADDAMRRQVLIPVLIDEVTPPHGFRQHESANLIKWNGDASDPQFDRLREGILSFAPPSQPVPSDEPQRTVSPLPLSVPRKFAFDVYISYAYRDDQSVSDGERGWIASLHLGLQVRLPQLLGTDVRIWREARLTANDVFADNIVEPLHNAAVFVAVVSPLYVRSEWCRRELNEFVKGSAANGGLQVAQRSRIIKVVKAPVPLDETPAPLQSMLGYEFFTVDVETGRELELRRDGTSPEVQQGYWRRLEGLAHDIAGLLKAIEG